MKLLPYGSTIYFAKNGKCSQDYSTPLFCLVNQVLYKVEESNHFFILNISDYNQSYYYELNILNNSNSKDTTCIISYIKNSSNIMFLHFLIEGQNYAKLIKEYSLKITYFNENNKNFNCQKYYDKNLCCYYFEKNNEIKRINFIKTRTGDYYLTEDKNEKSIQYTNSKLDNSFIILSILRNNAKYFICLNSSFGRSFKIYTKDGFPENNYRRIRRINGDNNKDFEELSFSCQKNQSLLIFSILNKSCIRGESNNDYDYNYIIPQNKNKNILTSSNDIECIKKEGITNTKQVFFFEPLENIDIIESNSLHHKETNEVENTYQEQENTELVTSINSLISQPTNIQTSQIITEKEISEINTNIQFINQEIIKKELNITKEDVIQNIESIINNTIIGEIYEIEGNNLSILIYPTNSTSLTNKTHIDFIECEYALRNYYNISNQSIISFFQIELNNPNKQSLINQVEYQVYDEYKNILDLSICNDSNIKIFHGIKTNSGLNVSLLNSFKDTDINIFNISDDFFNDVCYPYSENGNDMILEDRIKDIYQNYTLCEEDCIFENIDLTNMLIECKCNIKQNISTVIHEIKEEAVDEITSLNFEIIKCYNLAFTFNGKNKNIGFWILSIFLLAHLPLLIIYFSKGIKPVEKYIFNEMENYGYINKDKNGKINENKNIRKSVNIVRSPNIQDTNINFPPKKRKLSSISKNNQIDLNFKKKKKSIKKKSLHSLINNVNISNNFFLHQNKIEKNILPKDKNNSKTNLELNLITINLNNLSKKKEHIPKDSNITLYNYTMEEAFKYDRRNYCVIFYIYFLSKQAFFHAFLYRSPLVIFPL